MRYIGPKMLTEEEAEGIVQDMNEWKATQPDYIAVEMTNAEIVKELQITFGVSFGEELYFINREYLHKDHYRVIDGKLHKKTLNPKYRCVDVIPWPDIPEHETEFLKAKEKENE